MNEVYGRYFTAGAAGALHRRGRAPAERRAGRDRRHRAGDEIAKLNLTDRIYVAVHVALTVLVCARYQRVEHWPWYVAWNLCAIAAILLLARKQRDGLVWEFAHDWLPAVFFITVFEEVSFLSLSIRGGWQNDHLVAFGSRMLFAVPPAVWMHAARCVLAGRVPGVRLFRVLSAVPGCGRSVLDLARPAALRECVPPADRRAQRRLPDLLRDLSAVPDAESGEQSRSATDSPARMEGRSRAWCSSSKTTAACTAMPFPARTSCWRLWC